MFTAGQGQVASTLLVSLKNQFEEINFEHWCELCTSVQ